MLHHDHPHQAQSKRLHHLDELRALALVGMVIYHLYWDLIYFQFLAPSPALTSFMTYEARLVAGSFLFLAGFSLYLAQGSHFKVAAFTKRLIVIIVAALAISVVTWFMMPENYIYFGILHHIALGSLLGLLFLYSPLWLNAVAILGIIILWSCFQAQLISLNIPALMWIGLNDMPRPSFDFVPLIPWFAIIIAGISIARIFALQGWNRYLQGQNTSSKPIIFMRWCGRHSLFIYLIHQIILYGLVFIAALIFSPQAENIYTSGIQQCSLACTANAANTETLCLQTCQCIYDGMVAQDLLDAYSMGEIALNDPRIVHLQQMCSASND